MGIYGLRRFPPTLVLVATILTDHPCKAGVINDSALDFGTVDEDAVWREALEPMERSHQTVVQETAAFYQKAELMMIAMSNKTTGIAGKLENIEERAAQQWANFRELENQQLRNTEALVRNATNFHGKTGSLVTGMSTKMESMADTLEAIKKLVERQQNDITKLEERSVKFGNYISWRDDIRSTISNANSFSSALAYIQTLPTQERKNFAYVELVTKHSWRINNNDLTINDACHVLRIPQLFTLRIQLPASLQIVFSDQRKAIKTRQWTRRLVVEYASALKTYDRAYYDSTGSRIWKFLPVDNNCEHFFILHEAMNKAVGVVDHKDMSLELLSLVSFNSKYHWKITLQSSGYYVFMNKFNSHVLDTNADGKVYPHVINGGQFQDWELK